MFVAWMEFNDFAYHDAIKANPQNVNREDYAVTLKGKVIYKYTTFFGTPKFAVKLHNGEVVTIRMDKCTIIEENEVEEAL